MFSATYTKSKEINETGGEKQQTNGISRNMRGDTVLLYCCALFASKIMKNAERKEEMLKRILSVVLLVMVLLPSVIACSKKDAGGSNESANTNDVVDTTNGSSSQSKNQYDVQDAIGTRDYGGKEVTLANVNHANFINEAEVSDITGEIVSDAIYKRNRTAEKRLNVKIKNYIPDAEGDLHASVTTLRKDIEATTRSFDIMFNPMYTTTNALTAGLYYDLYEFEDIDFDQPYWGKFANEAMEIGGKMHLATGPIALNFYRYAFVTLVNETLLKTGTDAPDILQVVKDGKWTLEYQTALAEKYYLDRGNLGADKEDILGFYGTQVSICLDPYLASCGIKIVEKDADGYLKASPDVARMTDAMDDVIALHTSKASLMYENSGSSENIMKDMAATFASGNTLMVTFRLYELSYITNMKDKYVILPVAKLNEDQLTYNTTLHDSTTCISVPVTVAEDDKEMIGAVIEVLACESYRQVTPAYYETVLRARYTSSTANWEILDDLMTNIVLDPAISMCNLLKIAIFNGNYTPVGNWRYCLNDAFVKSATTASSRFNEEYIQKLQAIMDQDDPETGKKGVNTFYKDLNAN